MSNMDPLRCLAGLPLVDHYMYNVQIDHSPTDGYGATAATFSATLQQPLMSNPSDFYMSVIRMTCPTTSIPTFVMQIQPGSAQFDPNLSVYSVTLQLTTDDYLAQKFIEFIPSDMTIPIPSAPASNPPTYLQTASPYYFMGSYQALLNQINAALARVAADLAVGSAPYIIFDPLTQIFSIIALIADYDINLPDTTAIYFNAPLFGLFVSFPATKVATGDPNGQDYQIIVANFMNNTCDSNGVLDTAGLYYRIDQGFVSTSAWNPATAIVLTTGSIPIQPESIPVQGGPLVSNTNSQSGAANQRQIVTDFVPDWVSPQSRSTIVALPTAQYRYMNLLGTSPLTRIDLSVWWTDVNGIFWPIQLFFNEEITIKLLFVKKTAAVI